MQTLTKFRHDKGLREYKSSAKINSCNTRISHQAPPYSENNRAQLTMFPNLKNKIKDLRYFSDIFQATPRCSMYGIFTSTLEVKSTIKIRVPNLSKFWMIIIPYLKNYSLWMSSVKAMFSMVFGLLGFTFTMNLRQMSVHMECMEHMGW